LKILEYNEIMAFQGTTIYIDTVLSMSKLRQF